MRLEPKQKLRPVLPVSMMPLAAAVVDAFRHPDAPATAGIPEARLPVGDASAAFFGSKGALEKIRKELGASVADLRKQKTTPIPDGCQAVEVQDGVVPIVGVPASFLPGYADGAVAKSIDPKLIPRLPNLTERERKWESAFVEQVCGDLDGAVKTYREIVGTTLAVDGAKSLFKEWGANKRPANDDQRKVRAEGNAALHPMATTVANLAFMQRIDELAALSAEDPLRHVIITAGGAGAGKGNALGQLVDVTKVGAIYDSAGEGECADLAAKLAACLERNLKVTFIAVYATPSNAAKRLIERAQTSGRIVDLVPFARSHTVGVQSFRSLTSSKQLVDAKEDGRVSVIVMRRTAEGEVVRTPLDTIPDLGFTTDTILRLALKELADAEKKGLPNRVLRGALTGLASRWPSYDTVFDTRKP